MTFIIQIVDAALPSDLAQRNRLIDSLRDNDEDDKSGPSEALQNLYRQLVQKYPCISTFSDDALDECVWGDGPLIRNFGKKVATLNIYQNEEGVVAEILRLAGSLNLKVVDPQSGFVYYPNSKESAEFITAVETQVQAEDPLTKAKVVDQLVKSLMPILTPLGFVWSQREMKFNKKVSYGKQYFDICVDKKSYGEIYVYFSFRLAIDVLTKLASEITGESRSKFPLPFFGDFFTRTYREFKAENQAELDALTTEITFLTSDKIVTFLEKLTDLKSIYSTIDHEDKYRRIFRSFCRSILALTYLVCPEQLNYVAGIYLRECPPGGYESEKIHSFVSKLLERSSKES